MQAFISYARDDDSSPVEAEPLPGFVKTFNRILEHEIKMLGPPRPELWRDVRNIEHTDQFKEILERAVWESDYFIVVLSPNWLTRDWCRSELEWFQRRWAQEGATEIRKRILLVNKTRVSRAARPPLLQDQEGHDFFSLDQEQHEGGRERPFFDIGKVRDDRFYEQVRELASKLHRLAETRMPGHQQTNNVAGKGDSLLPANGRTIYVAQTADDVHRAYARIVEELKIRGFFVVPEGKIPTDRTAVAFIDAALANAELSVHVLGRDDDFAPAGQPDRIVRLQLGRAMLRAEADNNGEQAQAYHPRFQRIIWAPKVMDDLDGESPREALERDPFDVIASFGEQLETDKVGSLSLTSFINFLIRHLDRSVLSRAERELQLGPGARIYLEHNEEDASFADDLAEVLQQRSFVPIFPAMQGPRAQRSAVNRNYVRSCNAIALCWGNATETWAMAAACKLDQWRRLGREERPASALVAAPPRDRLKERRVRFKPPGVDVVLNLMNREKPSPEDLDVWLGALGSEPTATEKRS